MVTATCGNGSQQHRAPCPLLSWQLAAGSWEQAGPHPSRSGQVGQGLSQAREGIELIGQAWALFCQEGRLGAVVFAGEDFFGIGEVCPCTLTLIIVRSFNLHMHLCSSFVVCMYPWVCVRPKVILCVGLAPGMFL